MSKEITSADLQRYAEYTGLECRSYSGRGMYGDRCFAITCTNAVAAVCKLIAGAVDLWEESEQENPRGYDVGGYILELTDALELASTDSMGRDMVVYWPRIEWPSDLEETEESEDE